MAGSIPCDNGCGNQARYLLTDLDTGQVLSLDPLCWAGFIEEMAKQLPGGPAEVPPAEAEAAQLAAREAEAARRPPRPKRRQDGRHSAEAALASEASPFPDATPDES